MLINQKIPIQRLSDQSGMLFWVFLHFYGLWSRLLLSDLDGHCIMYLFALFMFCVCPQFLSQVHGAAFYSGP